MRTYVRFKTSGGLSANQRRALELLADHELAAVGGATEVRDGKLVIHSQTARSLVGFGFADVADADDAIEITREGLLRLGRLRESRAERKARVAREALEAQASGEWRPAPAGASAQVEEDYWWARREWAEAQGEVSSAHEEVNWAKQMLRLARAWNETPEEIRSAEEDLATAEARLEKAKSDRDELARQQNRSV